MAALSGCGGGTTVVSRDSEIFRTLLPALQHEVPELRDAHPVLVHPHFIRTGGPGALPRPVGTQADFVGTPSQAIERAVVGTPGFALCRLNRESYCEAEGPFLIVAEPQPGPRSTVRVWALAVSTEPAYWARYMLGHLRKANGGWVIDSLRTAAWDN
jgi:hypothetical protein